jgi:hypothetical protein
MDDNAAIQLEAELLRSTGVLGGARLRRLFDYLVDRTLAGQAPKEIAVAVDVFGKTAKFDVSQDAVVRVYVHKLRRTLDEFYAASAKEGHQRLFVPKGEYRLKVIATKEPVPEIEPVAVAPVPHQPDRRPPVRQLISRYGVARGLGLAALGMIALIVAGVLFWRSPHSELDQVRANPIWSSILTDERPIRIVVGDYYLIGEVDSMGVKRLIREYTVNSKIDLNQFITEHPEAADRYIDVGLRYLPVSSAFALRDVMAILAPQNGRITISKMSDVEPSSLKSDDIIYIGYLSGMGMLQDLMFTPESRLAVGESYDEIVDKKTRHFYVSQVGSQVMERSPSVRERPYRDYGLFAKFRGPGGNLIVVISGTRDEGVSQTAETFTNNQRLGEFAHEADVSHQVEALLEVRALDGVNLSGKLILESTRRQATMVSAAEVRGLSAPVPSPAAAAQAR